MNAFAAVVLALTVAGASAGHLGLGLLNPAVHIPSGTVSVGHNGAVIAGPAGSVHTDNGLHGHGAGAQISGPAGDVETQGGHARLTGPGVEHGYGIAPIAHSVAPAVHSAPAVLAAPAPHAAVVGPSSYATIVGPTSHATIVGPSSHATLVAPVASTHIAAPAQAWGHGAVLAAPADSWGHSGIISEGLVGLGHHGW